MAWSEILERRGLAVITGGASGVGFAAAESLAAKGFDLLLADRDADSLESAADRIRGEGVRVHAVTTDVAIEGDVRQLAEKAFELGQVRVLMNNAGVGISSSCLEDATTWRKTMDINFFGILNGIQAFVPRLLEANEPAAIINTGSKQGITTPPGNPAYNASKAAVKVLTEQLAHELRTLGAPIDTHLFVPGFTYTSMISRFMPDKPDGAWSSEETVAYLFDKVGEGAFYILCPDNMVDAQTDARRVLWSAQDIVEGRPALSRWHPDWEDAFAKFESEG